MSRNTIKAHFVHSWISRTLDIDMVCVLNPTIFVIATHARECIAMTKYITFNTCPII